MPDSSQDTRRQATTIFSEARLGSQSPGDLGEHFGASGRRPLALRDGMLDLHGALAGLGLLALLAGSPGAQAQTPGPAAAPAQADLVKALPAPLQSKGRALLAETSEARRTELAE